MNPVIIRLRSFLEDLSLRKTLAVALIAGLAVPLGICAWLHLTEQRAILLESLNNDHARINDVLALGMQSPIWEIRPDAGKRLLEALMLDERVTAISVSSPPMPRFLEIEAPQRRRGETLTRESPVVYDGEVIGQVRVEMDTGQLEFQLAGQWVQVLVAGLLQFATGMLIIFTLMCYKVMAPLRRLVDQSEALAAGELDQPLVWRRGDELGVLGRRFEKMRRSLRDRFADLEQRHQDLQDRKVALTNQASVLRATLDIGEHKKAEQERQRWLQLFQDAIESTPNGFSVYDAAKRLVICNSAFASLYGVPARALVGCTAVELYARVLPLIQTVDGQLPEAPEQAPHIADHNWLSNRKLAEIQLKDGRWLLVHRHPTAEDGNVFVRTDITHLKQMEQALRESEQRFRSIAEAYPVPVVICALGEDRLLYVSPGMASLLGSPVTKIICRPLHELFADPADGRKLEAMLFEKGAVDSYECAIKKVDGSTFPVAITAKRIDYLGTDAAVGGIIDLTEIKRAEQEIARQREVLHQSEKLRALGSLLAGVAHELNNPLAVVVGRTIMLEGEATDPEAKAKLKKIRLAAERCARIVKTFLAIARQQPPERAPVQLNTLVEEAAVELVGYGLRTAEIEAALDLAPDLPELSADADQLTQVFTNLIVNAQQALLDVPTPRRLTISTRVDQTANTLRMGVVSILVTLPHGQPCEAVVR